MDRFQKEQTMQFLDKSTSQLKRQTVATIFVCGVFMSLALGITGKAASTNAATDQAKINGIWSGELVEKDPDGNPKSHGYLYLRLEQGGDGIRGVIGENEATATPISDAVLSGNHLRFVTEAPGGPKGPVKWVLDLDVTAQGDEMTGRGHAFRKADNHAWDAEAKFSRQQ
ncbi:MAG TPA: hypothetical protein VF493_22465 [Terriglobales bacterium]